MTRARCHFPPLALSGILLGKRGYMNVRNTNSRGVSMTPCFLPGGFVMNQIKVAFYSFLAFLFPSLKKYAASKSLAIQGKH